MAYHQIKKRKVFLRSLTLCALLFFVIFLMDRLEAKDIRCPGVDSPPPRVLQVSLKELELALSELKDEHSRPLWKNTEKSKKKLEEVFESIPSKTKLEQFFQLLFLIQNQVEASQLPLKVQTQGIVKVLLTAKVFTRPDFPKKITSVILEKGNKHAPPLITVNFSDTEVRFPLNEGHGFAAWDQGMCQTAKELVFYPGFSFRLRKARNSKNLVVDHFDKVEIFGEFGTRQIFFIDLRYVDLEKVEFINGTDEGKVKVRVAEREFRENKHSSLFQFVGSLIPSTTRQRIDW